MHHVLGDAQGLYLCARAIHVRPYRKYTQPAPTPQYRLAYKEKNAPVVRTPPGGLGGKDKEFPHYTPAVAPKCQ